METLSMANAAATVQVQQMNQQSPVEQLQQQQQIVSLSDMTDLTHDIQEDIVSIPKEVILISLVSQEQALYNPKHENYRNTQRKDSKWLEISESVGWSESQCKSKWKAMRDQYCRELKRSKFNAKANVKWKYFKELDFLRPYALSRNYRPRNSATLNNGNNNASITTLANNSFITNNNISNNSSGASSNNNSITIDNNSKFPNIKIEAGNFDPCEFTTTTSHIKNDTSRLIATTLTDEQLNNVIQQQQDGNWNYLTATTTTTATTRTNNQMPMDSNHLCEQQHQQTRTADDVLFSAFVDCVNAATAAGHMQQNQQQQQQQQLNHHQQQQQLTEEEDDDPIHTFLNIESYFEKELIAMIQQEDVLYNSFHANYRNIKLKLEVWDEIARKLKKTVKQCRLKWKALRDQYIREHKRLKNRENAETLPRWKHYDALNFLQKFIKHKSNDFDGKNIIQIPKIEMDTEIDDNIMNSSDSPLRSPIELQQQQQQHPQPIHTLPSLTGPHIQQQHQQLELAAQNNGSICVNPSSVSAYDEMDIDNYIIGNASDDPRDDVVDDDVDEDDDDQEDRKSHQFPDYTNGSNDNNDTDEDEDFKEIKSTTQDSLQLPKQQTSHQQQQQQEQIIPLIISNGNTLTTDESLQHHNHNHHTDYNIDTTQTHPQTASILNVNGVECVGNANSVRGVTGAGGVVNNNNNNNNLSTDAINMVAAAITNGSGASAATTSLSSIAPGLAGAIDDDEVGAFFKAVAMKIRSAKMSPVAFTDLQIDILRVINGTLRNH